MSTAGPGIPLCIMIVRGPCSWVGEGEGLILDERREVWERPKLSKNAPSIFTLYDILHSISHLHDIITFVAFPKAVSQYLIPHVQVHRRYRLPFDTLGPSIAHLGPLGLVPGEETNKHAIHHALVAVQAQ